MYVFIVFFHCVDSLIFAEIVTCGLHFGKWNL